MSDCIVPCGHFLNNDHPHNFATLAREFLDAAKFTNCGFGGMPMWPTYFLVFQSLENFLKAYLLANGATMKHVEKKVGHRVCDALAEAKAKGLVVHASSNLEASVLAMSRVYTARDFQYRSIGEWELISPNKAIGYVEAVSKVVTY